MLQHYMSQSNTGNSHDFPHSLVEANHKQIRTGNRSGIGCKST